jgi:predicted Zn-dependent protease
VPRGRTVPVGLKVPSVLRGHVVLGVLVATLLSASSALAQPAKPSPSFEARATQAAAARDAGKLDEAVALYRALVKEKPAWEEGHWYLGSLLYELDRPKEARTAFAALIARQPEHAGAFGMKGLCEFQIGLHEEALRTLLRSRSLGIAKTPGIATVVRYHAGILLTKFGEFEVGYSVLSELALDGQESPQVIEAFGLNLLRVPVLPSEIDAARRPLVELAGRAAYTMAARQLPIAKPLLDDLVAQYPTTPNVHYARGVFKLTEATESTLDDFKQEIATSPAHVPARLQIAFELIRRGEAAAARPYAEEAVKLEPGHFAARLALGQALVELGETTAAVAELERAVQLAPGSPQTHFMLARAYARAGRTADATRARAEFTRLDQLVRAQRSGAQAVGGIPSAGPR